MKILFCQLRNHGDIIRTFPLMDAIKSIHPNWRIGFTCYDEMVQTCLLCKNIDIIIPQKRFKPVTDIQGGTRVLDCSILSESIKDARKEKFDLYVDLHGVFQSAIFGTLCNIDNRLGRSEKTAKDGAHFFYNNICEINEREINRMERHFLVINHLFGEIKPLKIERDKQISKILLFPGSSQAGKLKRWPIESYIKLGGILNKKYEVTYAIGPEEQELISAIRKNSKDHILMINDWQSITDNIEQNDMVVGNDGAYMHIAVWKGVPAVILCGPTSPVINGVWKYGVGSTVNSGVVCACEDPWAGICVDCKHCMDRIPVDAVLGEIEKYV